MRIIAYESDMQNGKVILRESTGEVLTTSNPDDMLSWLCEPYEDTLRVCWDLDETAAPIIRLLGKDAARQLHDNKKARLLPYSVFYVPAKVFSVRRITTPQILVNLYHLSQYYAELDKPDLDGVVVLGQRLLEVLRVMGMGDTDTLTSPIAIYERAVLNKLDIPSWRDMPKGAFDYAWQCGGRLWIEAFQVGFWG